MLMQFSKMRWILLPLCLAMACFAQEAGQPEVLDKVVTPLEVKQEIVISDTDPSIDKLQWNRWTSRNFVVCSIDDAQAQYLVGNLEHVKTWIYTRWGFPDLTFGAECRLICVGDKNLYKKFFNIEASKTEVRVENEKPKLYVVFYLLDDKPSKVVPGPLTEICMANLGESYGIKLPQFFISGSKLLNGTIPDIRGNLVVLAGLLQQNGDMYFSRGLLEMSSEEYVKLEPDKKKLYDLNAMAFTLMLRKQFGELPLHHTLKQLGSGNEPQSVLRAIYKLDSYEQCDASFKGYLLKLAGDIQEEKTPDSYLQITAE